VEDMPFYYSLADVMLVSLEPHPVFSAWIPGKVQSYLACGKPILALLSGAGADVIKDSRSGLTIDSGKAEDLISKVEELTSMSETELLKMGNNALEYYDREFNRDKLISEFEYHLRNLS
jgi:glycosyltransferase involved in cell wall biosynthesis